MKTIQRKLITIDGHEISFFESGKGENVLLFHCSGGQAKQWLNFIKAQEQFHCIAPDFSWYGENELAPGAKSAPALDVKIIETFLKQYSPCHVVGHSYGATLLLDALQTTHHKILSATFIEPVSFQLLRDKDPAFHEIDDLVQSMMGLMDDNQRIIAAKKFINYWSYPYAWEFLDHEIREYMIERIEKIICECLPIYTKSNSLTFNDPFDYPVSLIRGQWTKNPAKRIMHYLEEFFEVDSIIIPFAGHLSPITKPTKVTKALLQSFEGISDFRNFSDTDQLSL